jgi:hypothetical protein
MMPPNDAERKMNEAYPPCSGETVSAAKEIRDVPSLIQFMYRYISSLKEYHEGIALSMTRSYRLAND